MKDERKFISLSDIVKEVINDPKYNSKQFTWYDMPRTVEEDQIITEDAEFEIIQPKQISQ